MRYYLNYIRRFWIKSANVAQNQYDYAQEQSKQLIKS